MGQANFKNLVLACLSFCFMPMLVVAKQSYPPYPEVWGYDVLSDGDTISSSSVTPMSLRNGDYLFLCLNPYRNDSKKPQGFVIHFFEGIKRMFTNEDGFEKYLAKQGGALPFTTTEYVELKDKTVIDVATNFEAYIKYPHNRLHYSYVRKIDDFRNANADYKLSTIGIATFCKDDRKKIGCRNKAYFLAAQLLGLADGTFLAFDANYYLFIRFDKDFKTGFKSKHRVRLDNRRELKSNLYIVPYSKIEYFFDRVAKRYTGEYNDDINKQFLDYLFQEEQKGAIAQP